MLILHFKRGMSSESIAQIFSQPVEEVEAKIRNFTSQFSNKDYLMNVINGLIAMNKKNAKHLNVVPREEDERDREIADLKRRLTDAQIKAEAYEEMVRLAEATYGISIRKKAGAK